MGFKKGDDKNRNTGGRPKGKPNKTTAEIKEIITRIVGNQLEHIEKDLDKIRKENPAKAMELSSRFIDYVIPKQSKIDLEGELRHKVEKVTIQIVKGTDDGSKDKDN